MSKGISAAGWTWEAGIKPEATAPGRSAWSRLHLCTPRLCCLAHASSSLSPTHIQARASLDLFICLHFCLVNHNHRGNKQRLGFCVFRWARLHVFFPGEFLRREWQYTKKLRNEEEQISDSDFDMVHREGLRDLFPGDWVTVVNSHKELRAVPGTHQAHSSCCCFCYCFLSFTLSRVLARPFSEVGDFFLLFLTC